MPAAFYDDAGEGKANVPVRENLGTDNPLCELPASSVSLCCNQNNNQAHLILTWLDADLQVCRRSRATSSYRGGKG